LVAERAARAGLAFMAQRLPYDDWDDGQERRRGGSRGSPRWGFEHDVEVDPDGEVAAYALVWLDLPNRVSELEPVGVRADQQRRGLGRAICLYALERLRDRGARDRARRVTRRRRLPRSARTVRVDRLPRA